MNEMLIFGMIVAIIFLYLIIIGIVIADYIITSLSFYTMAKRRGISNPWLSWIPVANSWIIGRIADDLDEEKGFKRNWGKVLIILAAIVIVGIVLLYAAMFVYIFSLTQSIGDSAAAIESEVIVSFVIAYIIMIPAALAATALEVLRVICIYKIFEAAKPEKVIKYLLLSLLVPLASAVCLLKCKDLLALKYVE